MAKVKDSFTHPEAYSVKEKEELVSVLTDISMDGRFTGRQRKDAYGLRNKLKRTLETVSQPNPGYAALAAKAKDVLSRPEAYSKEEIKAITGTMLDVSVDGRFTQEQRHDANILWHKLKR